MATAFPMDPQRSITVNFPADGYAVITVESSFRTAGGPNGLIAGYIQEGETQLGNGWSWEAGDDDQFFDLTQTHQMITRVSAGIHTYDLYLQSISYLGTVETIVPGISVLWVKNSL